MTAVSDWRALAACVRHTDPDALFSGPKEQRREAAGCRLCPVKTECLAWALDQRVIFGVYGGLTERQRRALLRRRPDVTSWGRLLEAAREQWQASQPTEALAGAR